MSAALPALLIAAASAGTPLLDAFKGDALKASWNEIAEDAEPRIAGLAKLGRDAVGASIGLEANILTARAIGGF